MRAPTSKSFGRAIMYNEEFLKMRAGTFPSLTDRPKQRCSTSDPSAHARVSRRVLCGGFQAPVNHGQPPWTPGARVNRQVSSSRPSARKSPSIRIDKAIRGYPIPTSRIYPRNPPPLPERRDTLQDENGNEPGCRRANKPPEQAPFCSATKSKRDQANKPRKVVKQNASGPSAKLR